VPHSDHSLIRKRPLAFATITVFGIAALLLGLALVIFAHYHERAYVFLCMGAGGFIGGIAGIVAAGWRVRAALRARPKGGVAAFSSVIMLGVIASIGMVVLTVGTIYLIVLQNQYAYLLLGAGAVCLIGGITCGIVAQSRARATSH
jgi:hypothetical protein